MRVTMYRRGENWERVWNQSEFSFSLNPRELGSRNSITEARPGLLSPCVRQSPLQAIGVGGEAAPIRATANL